MSLKSLIWSLTDFEFLASIVSIDFRNHRVIIASEFFNYLVGRTREHFNAHSKYDIISIITFIRRIYFTRLGLVSPHSMRRWFDRDLNIKYLLTKFYWKVNRHFTNLEQDNNFTRMLNERKKEQKRQKKNQKKKERRQRRRLAAQQQIPEQQPDNDVLNSETEKEESEHLSQDEKLESENEVEESIRSHDEEESVSSEVAVHSVEEQQNDEIVRTKASEYDITNEDDFNSYWDLVEKTVGHTFSEDNDWDFITQLLRGGISPIDAIAINDEIRMRDAREEYMIQSEDDS